MQNGSLHPTTRFASLRRISEFSFQTIQFRFIFSFCGLIRKSVEAHCNTHNADCICNVHNAVLVHVAVNELSFGQFNETECVTHCENSVRGVGASVAVDIAVMLLNRRFGSGLGGRFGSGFGC